jgi:hypothetical protein
MQIRRVMDILWLLADSVAGTMTMDLQQQRRESCRRDSESSATTPRATTVSAPVLTPLRPPAVTASSGVKRSFDVAFLVAPDERRAPQPSRLQELSLQLPQDLTQRSAFTKVSTNKVIDLSADRLSPYSTPSPPRSSFVPAPSPPKQFASIHKGYTFPTHPSSFLIDHHNKEKIIDNYIIKTSSNSSLHTSTISYPNNDKDQLFKLRPMLYPEAYISAAYPYAAAAANFVSQTPQTNGNTSPNSVSAAARAAAELLRPNPSSVSSPNNAVVTAPFLAAAAAAAISPVSSLLPPSLAALSLPAQNICAKCNLSFRMTSDLVYHMRSHHKSETYDPLKRRREEKLKCPVCSESFRERHHLTRHMTAHQDKAGDMEDATGMTSANPGHLISAGK